ncbi:hypothetical protein VTN96DRAFT_10302 [Rasamsonia emersonii]
MPHMLVLLLTLSNHGGPKLAHPERGDLLTVRELARLQGFPDDFVFYGSKERQYEQVLEAFPPPVAKAIAG